MKKSFSLLKWTPVDLLRSCHKDSGDDPVEDVIRQDRRQTGLELLMPTHKELDHVWHHRPDVSGKSARNGSHHLLELY
jgi:hypothetical protein